MTNETQPNRRESLAEAQERLKKRMDSLAPFLPPSDRFPDPRPAKWRRNDPSRPKCKTMCPPQPREE